MTRTHIAQPISVSDITEVCDNRGHYVGESRVIVTVYGNCEQHSVLRRNASFCPPKAFCGRVVEIKYMHDSDESVIEYRFRYAGIIQNRHRNSERFRKKMLKQIEKQKYEIKPVNVSQCQPEYVDGKIKHWTVYVECKGDIATNTESVYEWRKKIEDNPNVMKDNPFFRGSVSPDFDTHVLIPNLKRLNKGFFEYDREREISMLKYSWPDGLFGRGSERAWKFRLKMLAQIQKQRGK